MAVKTLSKTFFIVCVLLCSSKFCYSQNVEPLQNDLYKKGIDLYEKERYADAHELFSRALRDTDPTDKLTLSEILSYRALCAIELQLPDMEKQADELVDKYPEGKQVNTVNFALGNKFFQEKKYRKSAARYSMVDSRALPYSQHIECTFKKGYSYFELKQYDKASRCFVEIKDAANNPYSAPATYYYGHIEYRKGNYLSAQWAFEKILNDDRFASQAAVYLVQIYFMQQEYEKAVSTGTAMLPTMESPHDKEVARIVAESYFYLKNFEKAREYFAIYAKGKTDLPRADSYFVGLVDYQSRQYRSAATNFEQVIKGKTDSLTQNGAYYLGATYINLNDKAKAKDAFELASKQNYSPKITEDALLQYAKLSLELKNDGAPLQQYFGKYPAQATNPEMREYAASYYISQKNYKKALDNLQVIVTPTDKQKTDIQQLNYLVGKEAYDAKNYRDAINYFESALQSTSKNSTIEVLSQYYLADSYFSQGQYKEAQSGFEKFASNNVAYRSSSEYPAALYNLGYCNFKQHNYDKADSWFQQFIKTAGKQHHEQVADAYNRIGDCNYVQGKYWPAAENFNKAIDMNSSSSDYALYRKAFSYGLLGRYDQKTKTLSELATSYPKSTYTPAGVLELGRTYLQINQNKEAETAFNKVINSYPNSTYATQAYIELGLLASNNKRPNDAIGHYKQALKKAKPSSDEAKSAMEGLQNAYTDLNNIEGYYDYIHNVGITEAQGEKEEAMFLAAEKQAAADDCDRAVASFRKFIADFPNSAYKAQSHYYIANCYYRQGSFQMAIDEYKQVINDPNPNIYKEQSLTSSSLANIKLGNNEGALSNLGELIKVTDNQETRLTALMEMARINYKLQNFREAANYAQSALLMTSIKPEQTREMTLLKANSLLDIEQHEAALVLYKEITSEDKNDKENAEALFHLIEITFANGKFDEGEKMVIEFGSSKANVYQYWMARSYIALADEYAKRGDTSQAKATYNSILEGYKNTTDGIHEMATGKLNLLK